jgi:hypothetical protein
VKYETSPAFEADLRRLSPEERRLFRDAVMATFGPACDTHARSPGARWPSQLRVKAVRGAPGVLETTWGFAGPDGRPTWEWRRLPSGEPCIRWRRVGGHAIFESP